MQRVASQRSPLHYYPPRSPRRTSPVARPSTTGVNTAQTYQRV